MKKKKSYLAEMITIVVVVTILVVLMVFMVRGSKTDDSKFIPNDYYEKYVAQGKLEKQYQYPSNDIRVFSEDFDVDGGNLTKISYYVPEIFNDEQNNCVSDNCDDESYEEYLDILHYELDNAILSNNKERIKELRKDIQRLKTERNLQKSYASNELSIKVKNSVMKGMTV